MELRRLVQGLLLSLAFASAGCTGGTDETSASTASATTTGGTTTTGTDPTTGADTGTDTSDPAPVGHVITHAFGELTLQPFGDNASRCVQWTLNNDEAVYAQSVLLATLGSVHHSNWYVVPEDEYEGEDGYFKCNDRMISDVGAALKGTVLFAQSTQSYTEEQRLAPGAVIKIPPRYKVLATLHTLNPTPRVVDTGMWLSLELLHPSDVSAVVAPISAQYNDLAIPAASESRFTTRCDFENSHVGLTGSGLNVKVHYVLPHYHYLGNFFQLRAIGGPHDGEVIYELDGFNADANGVTFDPPLELPGATGFEFACGYKNWKNNTVYWGNGNGEMCIFLMLAETDALLGGTVMSGNQLVGTQDGILMHEAPCLAYALPKNEEQGMPTDAEREGPLYLPPVDPDDQGLPPIPPCDDVDPGAEPEAPITLTGLRDAMFEPSCSFSACHGEGGAAGLDLLAADLHAELMQHEVQANTALPLIDPGNPYGSWLYRLVATCEPEDDAGELVAHMPANAPVLLDDELVATLRAWIEAGAPDD